MAGGSGTRLYPSTISLSKQLVPVYDKPMIYYSLSVLMLAQIKDIAIIVTSESKFQFEKLLGYGNQWGLKIQYIEQKSPDGLAHAYIIAEQFIDNNPSLMILGDNIFFGAGLSNIIKTAMSNKGMASVFGYQVSDPSRYGIVEFDKAKKVVSIEENP